MSDETGVLHIADAAILDGAAATVTIESTAEDAGWLRLADAGEGMRREWSLGALVDVDRFAALHRLTPYWMVPMAGAVGAEVPLETQWLMARRRDGRHVLIVPLIDGPARFALRSRESDLRIVGTTDDSATPCRGGRAAYVAIGDDPYELNRRGAERVARALGTRLRRDKPVPDFVDHFGWCTWDAFYFDVSAEKVRGGLDSFRAGGVEPRLLILDDGWQQTEPVATGGQRMVAMAANDKFDGDLAPLVAMAKDEHGVETVLVWHAVMGYWGGVDGDLREHYSVEDTRKAFGQDLRETFADLDGWHGGPRVGVVGAVDVARFYHDLHRGLASQGVDGVKVDNQASLESCAEGRGGRVPFTRAYREALEGAVQVHFGGRLINCMSHATETWYQSPGSTLIRGSDDFWPNKPESHGLHLATNAAVGLWFGEFMHLDWDMFQSTHERGAFHAAGRALSGGPIYVSDKPDAHDFELLRALVCSDGHILRCEQPGRLCPDNLYHAAASEAVPLKIWNRSGAAALVGAFHAWHGHERPLPVSVGPSDVPGLAGERFALRRQRSGAVHVIGPDETLNWELAVADWDLVAVVPIRDGVAAFGLVDKLAGLAAVRVQAWRGDSWRVELRDGGRFAAWCSSAPLAARLDGRPVSVPALAASGELILELPAAGPCVLELDFGPSARR